MSLSRAFCVMDAVELIDWLTIHVPWRSLLVAWIQASINKRRAASHWQIRTATNLGQHASPYMVLNIHLGELFMFPQNVDKIWILPSSFDDAYITWINDGKQAWLLHAPGMGPDSATEISARPVPQEPMVRLKYLYSFTFPSIGLRFLFFLWDGYVLIFSSSFYSIAWWSSAGLEWIITCPSYALLIHLS